MAGKDKLRIIKSYDALGGRIYDIRYRDEQEAKYGVVLEKIEISPQDIVLDDGCGTGLLLRRLNAYGVGLDFSSSLLSMAGVRIRGKFKAHLIQADADCLPFRNATFHRIFAVTLMQDMPNPDKTLREMQRVGRRRSQFVVTALKKAFTRDKFKKVLENVGFTFVYPIFDGDSKDYFAFLEPKCVE
ncbi:MAG: methyltransferase domain-containing protein [Nitrososphaeria archaeon]|nr:methyltransferase domain-containing protein [Nitrososphaeria archaeon]